MEKIISYLQTSIVDEVLSKDEKRTLKTLLRESPLDQNQLNFLRSKIYELANEKITTENYRFIVEWIKNTTNALISPAIENTSTFFSPGEACRQAIIQQIQSAIARLQICVFTISDDTITNALLASHQKGVAIKVITDNDKSLDEGSDIEQLAHAGISVKMDNSPNHMHHKFMVIDQQALLTGSYNWTRSAARFNHENIVITREIGVIKSFSKQFEHLWDTMSDFN